jgi:hypothetical protein
LILYGFFALRTRAMVRELVRREDGVRHSTPEDYPERLAATINEVLGATTAD